MCSRPEIVREFRLLGHRAGEHPMPSSYAQQTALANRDTHTPHNLVGISEGAGAGMIMSYGIFHGGFIQFVAGCFEQLKGNTFAGTAFMSYGMTFRW